MSSNLLGGLQGSLGNTPGLNGGNTNFLPTPGLGPSVGIGYGPAPVSGTNPVADQTQQMANNPIYGQQSPFQPAQPNPGPAPIGDTGNMGFGKGMGSNGQLGNPGGYIDGGMGFGKAFGHGPYPAIPIGPNPIPIDGTNPLQGTPIFGGVPSHPVQGIQQPVSNARQVPIQQPVSNARQVPIQQPQQNFSGGLKPAPRNYRPPQSGGNLRSVLGR